MAFRYDTRHLSPQVQQIIRNRDENNKIQKQSNTSTSAKNNIYPIFIFMRLGKDTDSKLDGVKTLKEYEEFCRVNKAVWFSTDSLATGMSEKRRAEFINAIKNGNVVDIFFAVGKSGGGNNGIQYKAEVMDIKTDAEGIGSPDENLTPDLWKDANKKIWIKIRNILSTGLKTNDFIVQSSKKVLAKSIEKSQYHFGYIKTKSL